MNYSNAIIILLLLQCVNAQSLSCWNGASNSVSYTQTTPASQVCIKYYNCRTGWSGSSCSVQPLWYYLSWDSATWKATFTNPNNINAIACNTNYCNSPVPTVNQCYTGYTGTVQLIETGLNVKCYSYSQTCTTVSNSCSSNDVSYKVVKTYYGTSNSLSCADINASGVNCCSGFLCNYAGVTRKSEGDIYRVSIYFIIAMLLVNIFLY